MKSVSLLSIAFVTSLSVACQDANYWSSAYGAAGFVFPGAVIAKNGDSGVMFYNPALLGFNRRNAATVSGNIYGIERTVIRDGIGQGLPLSSQRSFITPVVASNTIFLNLKKPLTIAYAIAYHPSIDHNATQRLDTRQNVLSDMYSPGAEMFVGQYSTLNTVDETQGTLSVGRQMTDKLSAGFSAVVSFRKQRYQIDQRSRALINNAAPFSDQLVDVSEYYYARNRTLNLSFKWGLAFDLSERQHVGLLVSLPSIHLFGKGEMMTDFIVNNLTLSGSSVFSLLANARQTGLPARWKMPLSVGAGYSVELTERSQLYLAGEFFTGLDEYSVVKPRNDFFIRADTGYLSLFNTSVLRLKDARKPVVNFGAGFRMMVRDDMQAYGSLRTDFNSSKQDLFAGDEGYPQNTSSWNIYHLNLGLNLRKRKFNLRAAIQLSYGQSDNYLTSVNYREANESNLLRGTPSFTRGSVIAASCMFAYLHNL